MTNQKATFYDRGDNLGLSEIVSCLFQWHSLSFGLPVFYWGCLESIFRGTFISRKTYFQVFFLQSLVEEHEGARGRELCGSEAQKSCCSLCWWSSLTPTSQLTIITTGCNWTYFDISVFITTFPSLIPRKLLLLTHQNVYLVTVLFTSAAWSSTSSGWRMDNRTLLTVECLSLWRAHCTVMVVAVTLAISNPSTVRGPDRMREGKCRKRLQRTHLTSTHPLNTLGQELPLWRPPSHLSCFLQKKNISLGFWEDYYNRWLLPSWGVMYAASCNFTSPFVSGMYFVLQAESPMRHYVTAVWPRFNKSGQGWTTHIF